MNADLSIHRMAFREADTFGLAQALVVKKRQDLELRLLRERVQPGTPASGSSLDSALRQMEAGAPDQLAETGAGRIDKTA